MIFVETFVPATHLQMRWRATARRCRKRMFATQNTTSTRPISGQYAPLRTLFLDTLLVDAPTNLSLYRFKVADAKYGKDELAAWACIRLDRIQQGYRFIHLFDVKGQATAGMLLVKIQKILK